MSSWLVEFFWFFKTILQTRLIRVRFRGKVWGLSKFPVPNERRTPNPPGTTKRWSQSCHFFSSEFRALKRRCGAKDPFCTSAKTMRIEGWRNLRFFLDVPEYTKVHFGSNYPTLISKKTQRHLEIWSPIELGFLIPQPTEKYQKLHVSVHCRKQQTGCAVCGATESVEVTDVPTAQSTGYLLGELKLMFFCFGRFQPQSWFVFL